jgi:hypothetical protein
MKIVIELLLLVWPDGMRVSLFLATILPMNERLQSQKYFWHFSLFDSQILIQSIKLSFSSTI